MTFLHGNDLAAPILPGIYFGAVLAVGAYAWKRKSLFAACVILFSTVIAWVVAWECAYNTVGHLNDLCKNAAAEPLLGPNTLRIILFLFGGIAGGFVGGLITLVGISIAISEVGTINNWWRTLFVASFAGTALGYYGYDGGSFILLFVVWQVAVAASIAFGWSFKETWKTALPLRARRQ